MAASKANLHCSFFLLICFSCIAIAVALQQGFTVDLIHRDSPQSPLYNPSKTRWQRVKNTLYRSTLRSRHFEQATSSSYDAVQTMVVPAGGEYLMNITIGTPPVILLGIADTGSDLTWTQCHPCTQCYEQSLPLFDPKKSSTYKPIACGSPLCYTNFASTNNCDSGGTCSYSYSYGDKSYTNGILASETVTFGGPTKFPEVAVGCGHDNGGTFNDKGSGLIGLGGGGLSLVSQIKPAIGGKFSYCLVPFFKSDSLSRISFGSKAKVSGPGAVSTPLVRKLPPTFYYLTLESIGIGTETFAYKTTAVDYYAQEGNIIIDSGTTLTLLPQEFYNDIEAALRRAIKAEPVVNPEGSLSLCYKTQGELDVPIIRARFAGAEVELKPFNTFVRVEEDVVCFAMAPATEVAIYGNLAQMNFHVGYDLEEGRVHFKPAECSQLAL